jgi:hypothetical protein
MIKPVDDQSRNPGKMTYEFVFDPVRHKSAERAAWRWEWPRIIAPFDPVWRFALTALLMFGAAHGCGTEPWRWRHELHQTGTETCVWLLAVSLWYLWWINKRRRAFDGKVCLCEITDAAWTISDSEGGSTRIPWGFMTIKMKHPEAWLIEYGQSKARMFVYREPLRQAGLEQQFLQRLREASEPMKPEDSRSATGTPRRIYY